MDHPQLALLGLILLLFAGGCGSAAPADTPTRTVSAGVLLVHYPELPPIEASRITIAAEPDLVLGEGSLAGPDHEFVRIIGVSQLRDGTLVVADAGARELRFYGADGQFLRTAGRDGDGPGEFRSNLRNLWIMGGDTLVTWDRSRLLLQHFSPDGAFVRSTLMVGLGPFAAFQAPYPNQPRAILGNGQVVMFLDSPWTLTDGAPERRPLLVALHRIDEEGWDSVTVVPGTEQHIVNFRGQFAISPFYFPAFSVAAGSGATLAVVDIARFRVELFEPDGRPFSIISASVPEVPVTATVVDDMIDVMVDNFSGSDTDAYAARLRASSKDHHAPFLPAIRGLFVDADERIWVERYDAPGSGSRWEVFGRDGTWIGRVEMPEGFVRDHYVYSGEPQEASFSIRAGRLAGVWRDPDTGVETVRVYRLIERGT